MDLTDTGVNETFVQKTNFYGVHVKSNCPKYNDQCVSKFGSYLAKHENHIFDHLFMLPL